MKTLSVFLVLLYTQDGIAENYFTLTPSEANSRGIPIDEKSKIGTVGDGYDYIVMMDLGHSEGRDYQFPVKGGVDMYIYTYGHEVFKAESRFSYLYPGPRYTLSLWEGEGVPTAEDGALVDVDPNGETRYAAVCHSDVGDVPGKGNAGTDRACCEIDWQEVCTSEFSYVVLAPNPAVGFTLVEFTGQSAPDDSFKLGTASDGYNYLVLGRADDETAAFIPMMPMMSNEENAISTWGGALTTRSKFFYLQLKDGYKVELVSGVNTPPTEAEGAILGNDLYELHTRWAAICHTQYGDVPGKGKDGKACCAVNNREVCYGGADFSFVVVVPESDDEEK